MLMAYEATARSRARRASPVETPLERTIGRRGERQEAHARADPARRARHGRGHPAPRAVGARRPHRAVPRPRHARAGGLLLQGPGRRGGARLLRARPDARHRRQRRRPPSRRSSAPARRASASSASSPRPRASRRLADAHPDVTIYCAVARPRAERSRATSCPAWATPATGCSARGKAGTAQSRSGVEGACERRMSRAGR